MQQDLQQQKGLVKEVFDKVFDKYDLMNDFMSLGIHRIWKKNFIQMLNPADNKKLIDVGCGTGDIANLYIKATSIKSSILFCSSFEDMKYSSICIYKKPNSRSLAKQFGQQKLKIHPVSYPIIASSSSSMYENSSNALSL